MSASGAITKFDGLSDAMLDIRFRDKAARGVGRLDTIVSGRQWSGTEPTNRPYSMISGLYAVAADPIGHRRCSTSTGAPLPGMGCPRQAGWHRGTQGRDRAGVGGASEAVQQFHAADMGPDGAPDCCEACIDYNLARAFEAAGNADSALAHYATTSISAVPTLVLNMEWMGDAAVQKRLGEIYDSRHDRTNAIKHYAEFVDLWKDADPELQPVVATVRKRIGELTAQRD